MSVQSQAFFTKTSDDVISSYKFELCCLWSTRCRYCTVPVQTASDEGLRTLCLIRKCEASLCRWVPFDFLWGNMHGKCTFFLNFNVKSSAYPAVCCFLGIQVGKAGPLPSFCGDSQLAEAAVEILVGNNRATL